MNYKLNSIRGIMERVKDLKDIGTNPYKRILMEKEKRNLSYKDLAKELSGVEPDTLSKMLTADKDRPRIDKAIAQKLYDVLEIQAELDKDSYKRILAKKNEKKLSYDDLAKNLSGVKPDDLKKILTAERHQRIDEDIVQKLYDVLGIQGELDNNEAVAVLHYIKNRPSDSGRPSKDDLDKRQKLYDEAHQRKSNPDKGEYSIDELLLDWSDMDDAEIESLTDDPEIESLTDDPEIESLTDDPEIESLTDDPEIESSMDDTYDEIGLLKRVLILNRQFPELFEELISNFEFEKAELEEMEHMEISIEIHE